MPYLDTLNLGLSDKQINTLTNYAQLLLSEGYEFGNINEFWRYDNNVRNYVIIDNVGNVRLHTQRFIYDGEHTASCIIDSSYLETYDDGKTFNELASKHLNIAIEKTGIEFEFKSKVQEIEKLIIEEFEFERSELDSNYYNNVYIKDSDHKYTLKVDVKNKIIYGYKGEPKKLERNHYNHNEFVELSTKEIIETLLDFPGPNYYKEF